MLMINWANIYNTLDNQNADIHYIERSILGNNEK